MNQPSPIKEDLLSQGQMLLDLVDRERKLQGFTQGEMCGSRHDFNQTTYSLAVRRGNTYLTTFLAFCNTLGITVILESQDGRVLNWED